MKIGEIVLIIIMPIIYLTGKYFGEKKASGTYVYLAKENEKLRAEVYSYKHMLNYAQTQSKVEIQMLEWERDDLKAQIKEIKKERKK